MKKVLLLIGIIIVLAIAILICYSVGSFRLLESSTPVLLKKIYLDTQNEVEIIYIPGNATSQNITQIRKINLISGKKSVLGNFERYNYLESDSLCGSNLMIVLRDTGVYHFNCIDTIRLNIHDVQYEIK